MKKKKAADNSEKPSIVCYRTLIVMLFFTYKKQKTRSMPFFELVAFLKKKLKI